MTVTRRELMATSAGLAVWWQTLMTARAQEARGPGKPTLVDDLVAANHFLAGQEVVDGYGHVSVRDPADSDRYLMARSVAPALVTSADILGYDLDSNPFDANGTTVYNERFIHGEIYRVRPEVRAVVHSHATALIAFGVTKIPLRPTWHMGAFIGAGVPIYEIRASRDANDKLMLIHTPALGKALARTLGDHPAALIRGHGAVIVGSSLGQAVGRSIYLQQNAIIQAQAMSLGASINYLDAGEAQAMGDNLYDRDWDLWKRQGAARCTP
jgi:ribulose-5-phosphate 4-epimerase/fuculose-1-phosphate aldolase